MFVHGHKVAIGAAIIGAVVAAAHVVLGVAAVLTVGQWVSGAVVGAILLGAAAFHLVIRLRFKSRLIDHEPRPEA